VLFFLSVVFHINVEPFVLSSRFGVWLTRISTVVVLNVWSLTHMPEVTVYALKMLIPQLSPRLTEPKWEERRGIGLGT
jgi:hypothetical protein